MQFSLWNQYFSHVHQSELGALEAMSKVRAYYEGKGAKLVKADESSFCVEKGSLVMSILGMGPETWLKHFVVVSSSYLSDGKTEITFNINLKLFGLTAGKNFLLSETKEACAAI
jgi:hypothetical protein